MPMNPTSVNSSYTYRTLPPNLDALRPLKSGSYPLLSLRRYFLRRGDLSQQPAQAKAVVRTNMKRGQGTSPTNLSGRKSKRRSSRGSRLAAAAEGISSEILSPSLQTKSSETSTAVLKNEHPEREAPSGRISARVFHALQVSRDTPVKESRLPVHSPQSARGSRSCAVSSVPSTVTRRTRASTTKTSTRRSTSKRPQEKEPTGQDGQPDVIGHEVKNLANLLYPAVEPQEKLDLTSGLEQQVDEERVDQKAQHGSGDNSPLKSPLEIMFHGLEQVLLLFRRRKQTPLLKKITAGVEAMCGRSFTKHHLAQILFIQPDAYKVSSKIDAKPTRGGYRLRDILIEFGVSEGSGEVNLKSGGNDSSCLRGSAIESVSSRRRKAFQQLLLITTSRYCKCTSGIENGVVTGECSCLPEAPLPDTSPLPVDGKSCLGTGGNGTAFPSNVRGLLGSGGVPRGGVESDGRDAPKNVDALRERLRQKDLISALKRNKSGEEKEADRRRKGNLPAVADAVRSFFAHSRRNTCGLTTLVEALSSSGRHALSANEAKERLRMLTDVVPEWCTIIAPPNARKGAGSRAGVVDEGLVGQPIKAQEVVRVNTRIHYGEVRQMIVFMAGRGDST